VDNLLDDWFAILVNKDGKLFNLYLDPKEGHAFGVRKPRRRES
jgi:hypothetical protein